MAQHPRMRAIGPKPEQETPEQTFADGCEAAPESVEAVRWEADHDEEQYDAFEEHPRKRRLNWLGPAFAMLLIAAWTGFYAWAMQSQLFNPATPPQAWATIIVDWAIPVLLVGVAWLVILRNSRREARRFAETAAELSQESARLETRLSTVNRELSLAREFLGTQSLELESLGRIASERLSTHAEELQSLIKHNGEQVEAIGSTSETALGNMRRLRDDLPVIATSAKDVTSQIANAGRTAQDQVDALVDGFDKLTESTVSSETTIAQIKLHTEELLKGFEERLEQLELQSKARFDALNEASENYRADLSSREVETLSAMRGRAEALREELRQIDEQVSSQEANSLEALQNRIATLRNESSALTDSLRSNEADAVETLRASKSALDEEIAEIAETLSTLDQAAQDTAATRLEAVREQAVEFDNLLAQHDIKFAENISRRQDEFDTREAQASEVLGQRLAELDEALAARRDAQIEETGKLVSFTEEISSKLDQLGTLLGSINELGENSRDTLTHGMGALSENLAQSREQIGETSKTLDTLTDSSVRLLEIIQSASQHSREDLTQSISSADLQLANVEHRAGQIQGTLDEASDRGGALNQQITAAQTQIGETDGQIAELQSRLSQQTDETLAQLQGLRTGLVKITQETHSLSDEAQESLRKAIGELEQATNAAFSTLEEGAREKLSGLATSMSEDAVEVLSRALRNESSEAVGRIEQAAAHASGMGREAAIQLRDQLAKVNELTGNLEQRVTRARHQAEEQVNNDFTRRMALIIESLNSSSIDITTALQTDVADTAMQNYLKGDRGIFTRRAVRLIDNGNARDIADLYQSDDTFRANVSRYIHDFEAMLRSMLSTRDGNALSVTVLSSDMGKLYVVLAQAIERFRN